MPIYRLLRDKARSPDEWHIEWDAVRLLVRDPSGVLFFEHPVERAHQIVELHELEMEDKISFALDSADNLYVADANNDRIRKVTPSGTIMIIAGNGKGRMEFLFGRGSSIGDGGPATAASILAPHGVAMDSSGNLYILDSKGGRVRKVSWPSR